MKFSIGLRNILISNGFTAISTLIVLFLTPEISKTLGFEKYGVLTLYLTLIAQLSIFDFGLPKFLIPRTSQGLPFLGYLIQIFSLFLFALFLSYFAFLELDFIQSRIRGIYLPIVFTGAIIMFCISSVRSLLEGVNRVTSSVLSRNIDIIVQTLVFFILSKYLTVGNLIISYFGFQSIHLLILILVLSREDLNLKIKWSNKELIVSGLFLLISSVLGPYLTTFERYEFQSEGYSSDLGKYVLSYLLASRIFIISSILQPYFYNKFSRFSLSLNKGIKLNDAIFLQVFLAMNLIAPYFLPIWLGSQYSPQILFDFRLILVGLYCNALARLPYDFLIINNRTRILAFMHFLEFIIILLMLALFNFSYYWIIGLVITRFFLEYLVLIRLNNITLIYPLKRLSFALFVLITSSYSIILGLVVMFFLILNFMKYERRDLHNLFS